MKQGTQRCWLRCAHCGAREWVNKWTEFGPCPHCEKGPRFAENDDGKPMIVWTGLQDATNWDPRER